MKSIFKKSVFMSIFAFSMILNWSQAYGMFMPLYMKIEKNLYRKGSVIACSKIQEFAQKCYETMTKNFGEEFENEHPNMREKIDNFVKENNAIKILFSPKLKERYDGLNYHSEIFINELAFFNENGEEIKDLGLEEEADLYLDIPDMRHLICHEVAHSWLGHMIFRKEIKDSQMEFEAEMLTIKTLGIMDDSAAIAVTFYIHFFYHNDEYANAYTFGALNGISSIEDQNLREKISEDYDIWQRSIKADSLTRIEKEFLNESRKLYDNWKSVKTYKEALSLASEILGKKIKDASQKILNSWLNADQWLYSFTREQLDSIDEVVSTIITLGVYKIFKKKNK